ncbi:hypothetical protein JSO54_03675 [Riemerella anatipestifer]|uniref:hypothetical protein n=1 Tax=Riemerella anatipestifer TaxID=34085 RepID=UPI0030C1D4EF
MESYNLVNPLQKRVNEIKESLYPQQLLSAGKETMIYGTYEKSFENYYKQSLRNGNRVNEIDYYNNAIKELEQIEEAVLQLEKQIHSVEQKNSIQFLTIFSIIHSVKQFAKQLIEEFENKSVKSTNVTKPRNIKSKLTYKWLKDENKLYDFKKLLSKYNLIDSSIDFQSFKFIFTENPVTEIKKRIVWQNDNATQLLFLIKELKENNIIQTTKNNFDYIQLSECFYRPSQEKFNPKKLKPLLFEINDNISSEFKGILEKIIKQLSE